MKDSQENRTCPRSRSGTPDFGEYLKFCPKETKNKKRQ